MFNFSVLLLYEDCNFLYLGFLFFGGYGQLFVLLGGYFVYFGYLQFGYGYFVGYLQFMFFIYLMFMNYGLGYGYDGEERVVSDSFGFGEWDDWKV